MVKFSLLSLAIFSWLQYSLWFGKNGINDYVRIEHEIEQQRIVNNELKLKNSQLMAEISSLSFGLDAIEERARNEFGMIKPNERFYRIITDPNAMQ